MSLARPAGEGGRISLILAFVLPAMIASALALAYYGYRGAESITVAHQRQFKSTAGAQAKDLFDGVERRMNEVTLGLFDRLGAQLENPQAEPCDVEPATDEESMLVDAFAVYHVTFKKVADCVGPRSKVTDKVRKARAEQQIWDQKQWFEWERLEAGGFKYVHLDTKSGPSLFVYRVKKNADGVKHYIVVRLNRDFIIGTWLDEPLRKLGQNMRVSVLDERSQTFPERVFGGTEPRFNERFLFEGPFGRQLYAWTIRIALKEDDVRELEADIERQRVVQLLLVVLSTVIIAVGLGIVFLAVVAERRASRMKSEFIANVSHELKTPLSLIRMFGEMVATGRHKGEEAAREYGGIITRESERLSHLIDNVLDFARLERGKASYDFAEGDLAAVMERALDVCRYRLEKERMKLRTQVDPALPPVRMDENALTLVILNLVDNALKYAAEGGTVEVSLGRTPGGVVLGVRDFGPGIPREEQARIFERFYRAQSARERNVRGSGIGLALVKHIAEAHGGRVTVESPVAGPRGGTGALFRVFLPAPVVEASEGDTTNDPTGPGSVNMDGHTVVESARPVTRPSVEP